MIKKILVFTGSRADYNLLKPIIKLVSCSPKLKLQLFVAGQHFSKSYGHTYKNILNDKFKISFKSKLMPENKSKRVLLKFLGKLINEYSYSLSKNKPHLAIILGDRYEVYSFCLCCYFLNIPIAHIHGGEVTNGAFDEALRHSITKMSNFHFTCHHKYSERVINFGENPKNIFNYGALGAENAFKNKKKKVEKINLFSEFSIPLDKKCFLVTYHPETKKEGNLKREITIFLSAIKNFKNIYFIFTYSNSDTEGNYYNNQIKNFKKGKDNVFIISSLGNKYLSLLKHSDCIIGNSSSGIIEAPVLETPTINIGHRQSGREFSRSIFNCENKKSEIVKKINFIIKNNKKINYDKIFYQSETSKKIFNKILSISKNLSENSYKKKFYEKK